jgi:NRPS condensation-like uncharacterized protein
MHQHAELILPFLDLDSERVQDIVTRTIHHALYDGWSWQLMLKDLRRILSGEELTSKPPYLGKGSRHRDPYSSPNRSQALVSQKYARQWYSR